MMTIEKPVVYVVDDDLMFQRLLRMRLESDYPGLEVFSSGEGILDSLRTGRKPDIVVLDYDLGSMTGLEVMKQIRQINPFVRVILFSAQEAVEIAVNAIKHGAYDYIVKDNKAIDNLLFSIRNFRLVDSNFYNIEVI